MSNELGNYLKQLRGDLSYREVAKRSNNRISHNYIAQSEKGVSRGKDFVPSPEKLKVLADVYHVSFDKLMTLAGYTETPSWATDDDVYELERMLNNDVAMSFGGEELTEEEQQRVKDVLTGLFWSKLHSQRSKEWFKWRS